VRGADLSESPANSRARAEAQCDLHTLYREIRLPGPQREEAADVPAASEARVERQRAIYQRYRGVDVFAEKGEGEGGFGEGTWLVSRHLQAPPCEIDAITAICFHIFAPAI